MFGEEISKKIKSFRYLEILKNSICFEEGNKNYFLSIVSKEMPFKSEYIIKEEKEDVSNMVQEEIIPDKNIVQPEEVLTETIENTPIALPTEVIQANNLAENYNTIYENVKIKNETNFDLSQDILIPDIEFSDKSNIIIFHTHTCESYMQTSENSYVPSRKF